jgi:hypothetical protein
MNIGTGAWQLSNARWILHGLHHFLPDLSNPLLLAHFHLHFGFTPLTGLSKVIARSPRLRNGPPGYIYNGTALVRFSLLK